MRPLNGINLNKAFTIKARLGAGLMTVAFGLGAAAQTDAARSNGDAQSLQTEVAPVKRKPFVQWNLSLQGDSFANEREQAQTAGLGLGVSIQYHLAEGLNFKANVGVAVQSGYAQSQFGDNTPRNGLDLREAFVQYRPLRYFVLEAGALDQGQLRLPILVSARSFPGVAERLYFGNRRLGVDLRAQQTVPTSTAMGTKTVEAEPTPSFLTETLRFSVMPTEAWTLRISGTHFRFNQLPTNVALASGAFGNSLQADMDHFLYEFQGYAAGGGTTVELSRHLSWNADLAVIQNTDAPEGYNLGQMISTSFDIRLPGEIDLRPQGEIFFAESDVSPAFYNDSGYGHSNRRGYAGDLMAIFKQAGFKLGLRYVNADLIGANALQTAQQYVMIRFETLYESLL